MKKILSILGTITLIGTSTTSLAACNTPLQYIEKELVDLKDKNNINTKNGILEWMAPQEKPFQKPYGQTDNKWYFVIWRGDKNHDWRIAKFKNNIDLNTYPLKRNLDNSNNYELNLTNSNMKGINLNIYKHGNLILFFHWWEKYDDFFKSVYRWDGVDELKKLAIDSKTGEINKEVKEVKEDK